MAASERVCLVSPGKDTPARKRGACNGSAYRASVRNRRARASVLRSNDGLCGREIGRFGSRDRGEPRGTVHPLCGGVRRPRRFRTDDVRRNRAKPLESHRLGLGAISLPGKIKIRREQTRKTKSDSCRLQPPGPGSRPQLYDIFPLALVPVYCASGATHLVRNQRRRADDGLPRYRERL